jgi:hypothetical protein
MVINATEQYLKSWVGLMEFLSKGTFLEEKWYPDQCTWLLTGELVHQPAGAPLVVYQQNSWLVKFSK